MEVCYVNGGAAIHGIGAFTPAHVFENGQAFRFTEVLPGCYEGVAHGRFLRVRNEGDALFLYPCTPGEFEDIWRRYFDLDRDYAALFPDVDDAILAKGRSFASGLRVLNQQPFETLVSFIISANNNLGRIRGIIGRLCRLCGRSFSFEGNEYYAFPTPRALSAQPLSAIRECGLGYRAPYVLKAAQMVAEGFDLDALRCVSYEEAKKALMTVPGVGPKVADCVLLFSLGRTDAFPADVWIKRVMQSHYGFSGGSGALYAFAREKFGECAGIAQQYIFYCAREGGL